jgi:flavodoxin
VKTLVIFYSRTGRTRKVAEQLSALLGADKEELLESESRKGVKGFLMGGRDAWKGNLSKLGSQQNDPATYDLTVLAGPVWAFTMCPAIRTYLQANCEKIKRAAFICTQGGSGAVRAFAEMEKALGKAPANTLTLIDKDIDRDLIAPQVNAFAQSLKEEG